MSIADALHEHQELRDSARRLFNDLGSFYQRGPSAPDLNHAWRAMADLGLFAFPLSEGRGGLGGDAFGALAILEECGRALGPSSLLANVMVAPRALATSNDLSLCEAFIAGGTRFAYASSNAGNSSATCETRDGSLTLNGASTLMLGGGHATRWLVSANCHDHSGDSSVLLNLELNPAASNIHAEELRLLDNSEALRMRFIDLVVPADSIVARGAAATELISELNDWATAGAVAEAFGALEAGFYMTADYLKQRVQFGRPIGEFQAVQHLMADAFCSLEQLRSLLVWCAVALDQSAKDRLQAVSAAKIYLGKRGLSIVETCIQVSGGVGVSEEYALGHYYKRIMTRAALFGDERYHSQRLCRQASIDHAFKGPMK